MTHSSKVTSKSYWARKYMIFSRHLPSNQSIDEQHNRVECTTKHRLKEHPRVEHPWGKKNALLASSAVSAICNFRLSLASSIASIADWSVNVLTWRGRHWHRPQSLAWFSVKQPTKLLACIASRRNDTHEPAQKKGEQKRGDENCKGTTSDWLYKRVLTKAWLPLRSCSRRKQ